MNIDAQLDGQHLLASNADKCREVLGENEGWVALVLDLRDHHARQCAVAVGTIKAEIDAHIRALEGKEIPTLCVAVPMATARLLLPHTSPTALESLRKMELLAMTTNQRIAVAVAAGGNTYGLI